MIVCSTNLSAFAQTADTNGSNLAARIEPQINRLMDTLDIPGVAVGIVEGDRVVYSQGFGVSDRKTNEKVTPNTLFDMASVSKVFTTCAVMQLAEQGKIDLDSPVVKYLPYFKLNDSRYVNITIRQLLTHTSGLDNGWLMNWSKPEYDDKALERFIKSLENDKLISEPGAKYNYSNTGFDILGDVVAKVSGESFEEYMKSHILKPLGMDESSFYKPSDGADLAKGYSQRGTLLDYINRFQGLIAMRNRVNGTPIEESPVYPYNRAHVPCGTLSSNVADMCSWIKAFLNGGTFENRQILSNESIKEMWTPYTNTDIRAPQGMEYLVSRDKEEGLGWHLGDYRGYRTAGHGGSDVGYMTYFCVVPERSLGVVVLCNADYVPAEQIASFLIDSVLGYDTDIEKLGKPPKAEPMDLFVMALPVLCLLTLVLLIFKKKTWMLVIDLLVLVAASTYMILATTIPLWVIIPADAVYLLTVFMLMKKKKAATN